MLGEDLHQKYDNQLKSLLIILLSSNKNLALNILNTIIKSIYPNSHLSTEFYSNN